MTHLLLALFISTQSANGTGAPAVPAHAPPIAQPTARPTAPPAAAPAPASAARPIPRTRSAVLSQGAVLSSAPGFVAPSAAEPGLEVFLLDEQIAGHVRRKLLLLPCDPTDDVKLMLAKPTPETPWRFEATGQVYDYNGRAFLLPSAIIALRPSPPPAYLARVEPAEFAPPPPPPKPRPAPYLDAYVVAEPTLTPTRDAPESVMPHERGLAAIAGEDDALVAELERRLAKGVHESGVAKPTAADVDRAMVLQAGMRLQERRATITRDPITGAWRAVLATAAESGEQLAMELLPCRDLERVERTVKEAPIGTPWLLSGEVVVSGSRNYLLLSHARAVAPDRWVYP